MKLKFEIAGKMVDCELIELEDAYQLTTSEGELQFTLNNGPSHSFTLLHGDKVHQGYAYRHKDQLFLQIGGRSLQLKDVTREAQAHGSASVGNVAENVTSPMPGSVIKVLVSAGQSVAKNQSLVIVEAMKMENDIRAPGDLQIDKVFVKTGQQVAAGEVLVTFTQPEAADD